MKINYCLPIIKNNKSEVLSTIKNNINDFDYFEVWLDHIEDLDLDFIKELNKKYGAKLIFLFRRRNLEVIKMSFEKRSKILSFLNKSDPYIDLDISTQADELKYIRNNNLYIKEIVSYHDYKETPTNEQILKLIDTINSYSPTILKISTFCNLEEDALRLLELQLKLKEKNIKHIISGMGEKGQITKIFGSLNGNEMVFCPVNRNGESAPGQLTRSQLEAIFNIINK